MSHQMSPPQRPYGYPYQQQPAHSPPGIALPPAKRPRLSPGIASPQSPAPSFPESPYGPFSAAPSGSAGSPPPFNAPQPYAGSPTLGTGTMGPPPKPTAEQKAAKEKEEKEKVTDISDISDAMWGSGVDLREEENYLSSTSRAIYGSQSFDSQSTITSPNNSFELLTQGLSAGQLSGSGPASQGSASREAILAEVDRKHRDAAYKYAKDHEQHLRDPFLMGGNVRNKLHKVAFDQGVTVDAKGLYDPVKQQPPQRAQGVNGVYARGPDDVGLAAIQSSTVAEIQNAFLEEGSRYADILSLVSLAANERMRALLDEAYTISRGRQLGSHGVVPPDLQDIATGEGRRSTSVKPESITNTAWDRPRSRASDSGEKQDTVSFTTALTSHLSSLALSEHAAEAQRIKRRATRLTRLKSTTDAPLPSATDNPTDPSTPATPLPATPLSTDSPAAASAPGSVAPEKPLTKKERERAAKAGQTEEVLHKNANVTAAMQLGFGKKAKKYSWMTGGAGGAGAQQSNPFAKPATPVRSSSTKDGGSGGGGGGGVKAEKASGGEGKRSLGRERKFGDWREDGPGGKGVQLRDLAAVLGRDRRVGKMLERAWLKLEKEGAADAR
ncbi:hypothetical protein K461DRAFT_280774 [Myriangium duriaei CBS 260.36]|uniref:Transcription initiation factor TFIID subunit 4 n=1 Tax=Myriangium duriaei CBS 260.36 TaxID=1168546 RepID=A0A9P4MF71_9PEZI|nr:hypothetical protein K461DRAFT_280774 [Myriangium duriaei CBS 260.36]